jgi:hypothetical protein
LNVDVPEQQRNLRKLTLKRVLVIFLMVDLVVMVSVASQGLRGNIFDGYYWPYSGWSLFPIPLNPNWVRGIVLPVIVPLSPLELLIYLIFIGPGFWVFWEIIGAVYIAYPWSHFLQSILKKGKSIILARVGSVR